MQSAAHPSASMEMVSEMGKRDEGMREQGRKMVNSVYRLSLLLLRTCSSEGRCSLRKDVGDRFLRSPGFARVVAGRGALRCSWCSFGHAERICSRLRERCELDDDDSWGRPMDRSESLGAVSLPKIDLRLVTRFCTLVSHSPYSTSTRSQTYAQALAAPLQNARTPAPFLKRFFPSRGRSRTTLRATLDQHSQQLFTPTWILHTQVTAARLIQIPGAFRLRLRSRRRSNRSPGVVVLL
jgi:hypothetical protein